MLPAPKNSITGGIFRAATGEMWGLEAAGSEGTYIDDGICLDVVHVGVAEPQLLAPALRGAHDARGHRVLKGKGTPNGHHKLPWPQVCRLTKQKNWQFTLQIKIEQKKKEREEKFKS